MKHRVRRIKSLLFIGLLLTSALFVGGCGKKDQLEPCTVKNYDETGQLKGYFKKDAYDFETEIYDGDGNLQSKYESERDSDGRLTERKQYDATGNLVITSKYEYKGETATVTDYNSSGEKIGGSGEWEFDSGNRPVRITNYNEDGDIVYKSEYERDSYGNIKKSEIYNAGSGELEIVYEQKIDIKYEDGHAVSAEVEAISYNNGQAYSKKIIKREYEY